MTRTHSPARTLTTVLTVPVLAGGLLLLAPSGALADHCPDLASGVLGDGTTRGGLATLARTGSDLLLPLLGLGLLLVVAGVLLRRRARPLPPVLVLALVLGGAALLAVAPTGAPPALAIPVADACHPAGSTGSTDPGGADGTTGVGSTGGGTTPAAPGTDGSEPGSTPGSGTGSGDGSEGGGPVAAPAPVVPEAPWPVLLPVLAAAALGVSRYRSARA